MSAVAMAVAGLGGVIAAALALWPEVAVGFLVALTTLVWFAYVVTFFVGQPDAVRTAQRLRRLARRPEVPRADSVSRAV